MDRNFIDDRQRLGLSIASSRILANNDEIVQRRGTDQCLNDGSVSRDPVPADIVLRQASPDPLANVVFAFANTFKDCGLGIDAPKRLEGNIGIVKVSPEGR